jgi:hypothetical protein
MGTHLWTAEYGTYGGIFSQLRLDDTGDILLYYNYQEKVTSLGAREIAVLIELLRKSGVIERVEYNEDHYERFIQPTVQNMEVHQDY